MPGASNGKVHPPAVECYLGIGRYFAVTGKHWPGSSDDVALLNRETLPHIAALIREATTDKAGTGDAHARRSRDNSRSALAFRKGAQLRRNGATFDEMCAALRVSPETADWCKQKGDAHGGRELLRIWQKAPRASQGPVIRVISGKRHEAADAGLNALAAAGVPFYQRDRALVRVCAAKAKASDGAVVHVPAVVPVTAPMLGRALAQSARWETVSAKGKSSPIDPPREVVEQIGSMIDEWPFPPLYGVIGTPTLRLDGSILATEGYDVATGLCAVPSAADAADSLGANEAPRAGRAGVAEFFAGGVPVRQRRQPFRRYVDAADPRCSVAPWHPPCRCIPSQRPRPAPGKAICRTSRQPSP